MMSSAIAVGPFVVVDVTDPQFFPGKTLTRDYLEDTDHGGTWFFFPGEWLDADTFGGLTLAKLRGLPLAYSPGYDTAERAAEMARKWADSQKWHDFRQWTDPARAEEAEEP